MAEPFLHLGDIRLMRGGIRRRRKRELDQGVQRGQALNLPRAADAQKIVSMQLGFHPDNAGRLASSSEVPMDGNAPRLARRPFSSLKLLQY